MFHDINKKQILKNYRLLNENVQILDKRIAFNITFYFLYRDLMIRQYLCIVKWILMFVVYAFASRFAIIFFHKSTVEENDVHLLLQKEKRESAKSDISKVLFPTYKKSLIFPSREHIDVKYMLTTAS